MDAWSVMHDWVFHPYKAGTQMQMLHNDEQEESTHNSPIQQSHATDSRSNISDGRLNCGTKSDMPRNMIRRIDHNYTKGKTRTRLGWIAVDRNV